MKKAIAAPFKKGVNFTNWLEFKTIEQVREDYFTRVDFEHAKMLGCDVVRLPIHFETLCGPAPEYVVPEKLWRILDNVLAWAEELGLYIIFDFHNSTTADSHTENDVDKVLIPIWSQVAGRYKDASDTVIYELMNEPHGIEIPVWNEIIARVFKIVRALDPKHYIVVGGADWNSFQGMKALPDFEDDKVIYTFHFYDPHTFTHQGANWCHMERVIGIPFPYDPEKMSPMPENPTETEKRCFEQYPALGTIEAASRFFNQYVEFSYDRKAPIYCGEFGCFMAFADRAQRVNWYKIVTGLLEERNISRTSWDYYGGFGIFKPKRPEPGKGWSFTFPEDLDLEIVEALGLNPDVQ